MVLICNLSTNASPQLMGWPSLGHMQNSCAVQNCSAAGLLTRHLACMAPAITRQPKEGREEHILSEPHQHAAAFTNGHASAVPPRKVTHPRRCMA